MYKDNPYEENDTFEEAYFLFPEEECFAYPDDRYDYYVFELFSPYHASYSVVVEMRNYKSKGDLLLYDEQRNLIGQWGRGGSEMRIEKEGLSPGIYYILVLTDPAFGFNMEDLYELEYTIWTLPEQ
jgi:hypothetical protein